MYILKGKRTNFLLGYEKGFSMKLLYDLLHFILQYRVLLDKKEWINQNRTRRRIGSYNKTNKNQAINQIKLDTRAYYEGKREAVLTFRIKAIRNKLEIFHKSKSWKENLHLINTSFHSCQPKEKK